MAPSLILFDLDETLFDHTHASRSGLDTLRSRHAVLASLPAETLEQRAWQILETTHRRVLEGEMTFGAARIERLRLLFESVGATLDAPDLHRAAREFREAYIGARRAVIGARELVESLRGGCVVGVVTNNFRREQDAKLADCGLTDLVDFMVTSEETGSAKPDAAIFEAALEAGAAPAEAAVMVGDSWEGDVLGALAAGIRPVWFNRREHARPDGAPWQKIDEIRAFEPLDAARQVILEGA